MINTKKMIVVRAIFNFIPNSRAHKLKAKLLRWAGVTVGNNVEITSSVKILGNITLKIGNNCFLGPESMITGAAGSTVVLEDYSKISTRCILVTGFHRYSADGLCVAKEGQYGDIRICAGATIAIGAIILPKVTVGRMAHVAAGAVVTKDVPGFHRVAGVPAKIIKDFRDDEQNNLI